MASKRRKQNLNYFTNDYYKLAVIFPILSEEEYVKRNQKRIEEANFKHFQDIKKLCKKEQMNYFSKLSEEFTRLFSKVPNHIND